ncbi:MAG: threonine--tRNA ligase [Caldiserica bacterium]|nr:MAG: threonine--tRNA ligase [Caldisericota bacterium]
MEKNLEILRHSASHIMASAVKELYPDAKLGIGPAIEDGFYYDFDVEKPFTPEDLKRIEDKMKEFIEKDYPFEKIMMKREEAKKFFSEKNEIYKVEILNEIEDEEVSIYKHNGFYDLCRGPHVSSTGEVKFFKLLDVAGAYWRGDEKNKMLQRIYGTAFFTKEELEEFLKKREEAKKRDHRKLGRELEFFSIHPEEAGPGLIYWHPKGSIVRSIIEDLWKKAHLENGYQLIYTPHIAQEKLYEISGHLKNYSEFMYSRMLIDDVPYRIRPMNCPGHILIYKTKIHSYRELPLRYAELGTVYRYEKSGVLHGLLRVRGFTIDDAHIFVQKENVSEEVIRVLDFSISILKAFGFEDFKLYLATRPEEKFIGEIEDWEKAENALKEAIERAGLDYEIDEGGGAFYGPKIDVKVKDALGRLWQCSTIQFDFNLPERFDVFFINKEGKEERPYLIHRAIFGSIERFFGVLIEHYKGAFPFWLAPVQVRVLNITDDVLDYAKNVYERIKKSGIRVELDSRNITLNKKIRESEMEKIPYTVICGKKEKEKGNVSIREYGRGDRGSISFDEFLKRILQENKNPTLTV